MGAFARWWLNIKLEIKDNGQTLVEFALVLPLLLLLVFGIIQFGLLFHNKMVITSAAREGARKAVVTSYSNRNVDEGVVENAIYNALTTNSLFNLSVSDLQYNDNAKSSSSYPSNSSIVWWCLDYPEGNHSGDTLYIYIKGKKDISIPFISIIIDDEVPLGASAAMRIERE